mmetsp:Transcript_6856/g.12799  ORF Transcript_6856/g.12799 Transcript_6856/m.12799 type:complete len:247 (-) Transcript_6856:146-886(-)
MIMMVSLLQPGASSSQMQLCVDQQYQPVASANAEEDKKSLAKALQLKRVPTAAHGEEKRAREWVDLIEDENSKTPMHHIIWGGIESANTTSSSNTASNNLQGSGSDEKLWQDKKDIAFLDHSDDFSRSGENTESLQKHSEDVTLELFPEACADLPSVGSQHHASGNCKPCLFVHKAHPGCTKGHKCMWCHFTHEAPRKARPCKSKRDRYRQHILRHQTTGCKDGSIQEETADNPKSRQIASQLVTL